MSENIIIREKYLSKLIPFIGKQIIKVFTGQRRVGKSYLLKQLVIHIRQTDVNANIIYINKEDLSFASINSADDLNEYVQNHTKHGQKNYVLIDEIQ